MKRALLIALLFAAPLAAAEPASPAVRPTDAPEVTDPDLKEATPAMREGTEEPVGGFRHAGMKGKSGLSLGWQDGTELGWTSWLSDRLAVKAALGGTYSEAGGVFDNALQEKVGLRCLLVELGQAGFVYSDLGAGARQRHRYQEVQTVFPTYTQFALSDIYDHQYSAFLGLGAEIFWPGSRAVSLEASAQLRALWSFNETRSETAAQPATALPGSVTTTTSRSFNLDSQSNRLTTALNVYF